MSIQWSTAVRNGRLDAIEVAVGTAGRLQLWTGAQPTNCAAAATGTKIAEWTLASDWMANASAGSKAMNNLPLTGTALANGTIGYYRITDNAGTVCHEQGSVTGTSGGGDMTVDNPTVTSGQALNVTAFIKTEAGA